MDEGPLRLPRHARCLRLDGLGHLHNQSRPAGHTQLRAPPTWCWSPAAAVLCAVPARGPLASEAQSALEAYGLPVAPVRIGQRAAFVHAMTVGQGAQEYEQGRKAAREIARLYDWTLA